MQEFQSRTLTHVESKENRNIQLQKRKTKLTYQKQKRDKDNRHIKFTFASWDDVHYTLKSTG